MKNITKVTNMGNGTAKINIFKRRSGSQMVGIYPEAYVSRIITIKYKPNAVMIRESTRKHEFSGNFVDISYNSTTYGTGILVRPSARLKFTIILI